MSRRVPTDEERKLFEQTFREGRPMRPAPLKSPAKKKAVTGASGVNGATQERMRRGLLELDARIDLHGMAQGAAHRTLFTWLAAAHSRGYRLVLVITGFVLLYQRLARRQGPSRRTSRAIEPPMGE